MRPDLAGVNVLVVEDDLVTRRVYESWLQDLGASVRCAREVFEALQLVWEARADVVLCDLRMPNFDGYAFVHGLRRDLKVQTPVIAITGANEDARGKALEAGFASCMTKPVEVEELGAEILRVLRRR